MTSTTCTNMFVEGYARISLDGDGRGLGVERQTEDIIRAASVLRLPLDPANIVVENDPTAGKPSKASASSYANKPREKYNALVQRVRSGQTTHVLAYSTSRLTRDMIEREELLALRFAGATIITAQGQRIYPEMSSSEVDMIRMLGVNDTGYSDKISELTKRAFVSNATAGTPHGPRAFGWDRRHAVDGTPVDTINDVEADVIREVARRVIESESLGSITRDLNERGVQTPRGGKWHTTTLRQVMLRDRNVARRVHLGSVVGAAAWAPIYDDDTHAAVVAVLTDPSRAPRRGAQRHLLSGLLTCGKCGSTRTYADVPQAGRGAGYFCKDCQGFRRRQDDIDEYVVDRVCLRMTDQNALDDLSVDPVALDAARAKVARLRGALAERQLMLDAFEINRAEFNQSIARLRPLLAAAEAEVDAARPIPGAVRALHGHGTIEATRVVWDGMTLDQQRAAIRALATITILPTTRRKFDASAIDVKWLGAR